MEEKEKVVSQEEASNSQEIEFMGNSYDINTSEGLAAFNAAKSVFEKMVGKQAQEVGQLRKEVPYVKKFGVRASSPDSAHTLKQITKLSEEGETDKALNLMVELYQKREEEIANRKAEDDFWDAYEGSRPEYFSVLDSEMSKDYFFGTYRQQLAEVDDPVAFADAVFGPKAERLKVKVQPQQVKDENEFIALGKGQVAQPKQEVKEPKKQESQEKTKLDQSLLDDLFS